MVKQILLSQGLGMGLGLGMIFTPTVGIISHHFARRRGLASAVALSGGSCGAVVFPISMLPHAIFSAVAYEIIRQCSSALIQNIGRDTFATYALIIATCCRRGPSVIVFVRALTLFWVA